MRQAGELAGTCVVELRQPGPGDDGEAAQQLLQYPLHRGSAEQQRLLPAPQVQDAVGEDVTALEVAGQLHLVDGHERRVGLARHRLHGADGIARAGRDDLLLAGDERHVADADLLDHAMVHLACEQPQRQADDAAFVRHHPLDGEMRLAGIGGAEHGGDVTSGDDQRLGLFHLDVHLIGNRPSCRGAPIVGEMGCRSTPMRRRARRAI